MLRNGSFSKTFELHFIISINYRLPYGSLKRPTPTCLEYELFGHNTSRYAYQRFVILIASIQTSKSLLKNIKNLKKGAVNFP